MVLSDSTPDNFAKILQIKLNGIRSMKFEKVQIHFLSDVFALLSSRKFFYDGNVTQRLLLSIGPPDTEFTVMCESQDTQLTLS